MSIKNAKQYTDQLDKIAEELETIWKRKFNYLF